MNKTALLKELIDSYQEKHRKSKAFFKKASLYQVAGGSHNLRLFAPFPFYDVSCQGSKVTDLDGITYIDFWQGHFANILGHNPQVVIDTLREYLAKGQGLTTGFPGTFQSELAELIIKTSYAEKVRFTTSGTLATMYAIMLAKSFTGRELVMKVGGGWHGAQPYALKGISIYDRGLNQVESAGLPSQIESSIVITRFNDIQDLEEKFRRHGERVACLIIEPFIGAGGFIFGQESYLQRARELTQSYGAILIFDEVISGFRFHAGGLQTLYGLRPDLSVFGKAIGGGMPVSAVAGRAEVMELCSPWTTPGKKVKFEGGTFSAHPAAMLAGLAFLRFLIKHEKEIYPRTGRLGQRVRDQVESIFSAQGFHVCCTGGGGDLKVNSALIGVHFLCNSSDKVISPEQVWNPAVCDHDFREKIFKLAMLEEGFNIFHGYGAISAAHTEGEIEASLDAVERIAKKWRKYHLGPFFS